MEQVSPAPAASAPLILNNREDLLRNHAALHFQQDSLDYESRRIRDHGTHKGVHGSTMPSAFGIIDSEERRDLVGHGGLDQLGTSSATSSFPTTHRLRHTPTTTDFQPPYFPPPYGVPQQPAVDFPHHHTVNPDPYGHLNHYTAPHHQQHYGVNDRHHLLSASGDLSLQRGFPSAYDNARRSAVEYMQSGGPVSSRADTLLPPRGPHDLQDSGSLLGLQSGMGGGMEDHLSADRTPRVHSCVQFSFVG
ncbi:hypothetical protein CAPTEDRAFT_210355 [Capitella teleta]|uniref:Uncharacterized protein n=1 Tax=Capitella teleta TaxID=283909 RepID=N1PB16_CAPTE|nr:hypothetical protein CAPTEDRAFT_210355 [Capitella teleta]|eukprot:ELU18878.1 hypothetical protein CAPTEDRAFT_210355 [Capitella teleta]